MTKIDPYKVLDVHKGASLETVREAYRALARQFHPDVADDPEAQGRMVRINAAWELLCDAALRAEWDDANGAPDGAGQGEPREP